MSLAEIGQISKPETKRATLTLKVAAAVAIPINVAAASVLSLKLPSAITAVVAFLPLPANIALILVLFRSVTSLDEFKRRVHLEGVLFAFLTTLVAILVFCFLRVARLVGPLHGSYVFWLMIAAYGLGYLLAMRRYK